MRAGETVTTCERMVASLSHKEVGRIEIVQWGSERQWGEVVGSGGVSPGTRTMWRETNHDIADAVLFTTKPW